MILLILLLLLPVGTLAQDSLNVFVGLEIINENGSEIAKPFNKIQDTDAIKLRVKPIDKDIYFYLLNQYEDKIQLNFRQQFIRDSLYEIPNNAEFIFDGDFSEEKLFLIISNEELSYLESFLSDSREIEDWYLIEEKLLKSQNYQTIAKEEFIKIAGNVRASEKVEGQYLAGHSPILIKYSFYIKK